MSVDNQGMIMSLIVAEGFSRRGVVLGGKLFQPVDPPPAVQSPYLRVLVAEAELMCTKRDIV